MSDTVTREKSYRNLNRVWTFYGLPKEGLVIGVPLFAFVTAMNLFLNPFGLPAWCILGLEILLPAAIWSFFAWNATTPKGYLADALVCKAMPEKQEAEVKPQDKPRPIDPVLKAFNANWTLGLDYIAAVDTDSREAGILFKEGNKGCLFFELSGIYTDTKGNQDAEQISEALHHFLLSLDARKGYKYGISYFQAPYESDYLAAFEKNISRIDTVRGIKDEQIKHLNKAISDGEVRRTRIIFECEFPLPVKVKRRYFLGRTEIEMMEEDKERLRRESDTISAHITGSLESVGMEGKRLSKKEVLDLLYQATSPDESKRFPKLNYRDDFSIKEQLHLSNIYYDKQGKEDGYFYLMEDLSGSYQAVMSLTLTPDTMGFGDINRLIRQIQTPNVAFKVNFYANDQIAERNSIKGESFRTQKKQQAGNNKQDIEGDHKIHEIDELLQSVIGGNEKIFRMALLIRIWDADKDALKGHIQSVKHGLQLLGGAECLQETYALRDMWLESMPGMHIEGKRHFIVQGKLLSHMLPVFGAYKGTKTDRPMIFFRYKEKHTESLVPVDFWNEKLTVYNSIIVGTPGGGKTFFANSMFANKLAFPKVKIHVYEAKDSYIHTAEVLGGQTVRFLKDNPPIINLFEMKNGDEEAAKENARFNLLRTTEGLNGNNSPYMPGLVKRAVDYVFQAFKADIKEETFWLSHFSAAINSPEFTDYLKTQNEHVELFTNDLFLLREKVAEYTESSRGVFFEGKTTIDWESHFLFFCLTELSEDPELKRVIFHILTTRSWQLAKRDKDEFVDIILDESWREFESEEGRKWIRQVGKEIRSYGGSITIIMQSAEDATNSDAGKTCFHTIGNQIWLKQGNVAVLVEHKDLLQLTKEEINQIAKLKTVPGEYSEVFIKQSTSDGSRETSGKVVHKVFGKEYWHYTSKSTERSLVEAVKQKYPEKSYDAVSGMLAEAQKQVKDNNPGISMTALVERLREMLLAGEAA